MKDCGFISSDTHESQIKWLVLAFFPSSPSKQYWVFCLMGFCTPGFAAQTWSHCSKQELAINKYFRTVLPQWLYGSFTSWRFGPAASVSLENGEQRWIVMHSLPATSINSQSRLFKVLMFNFSTTCETVKRIQIVLGAREGKVDFVLPSFFFTGNR